MPPGDGRKAGGLAGGAFAVPTRKGPEITGPFPFVAAVHVTGLHASLLLAFGLDEEGFTDPDDVALEAGRVGDQAGVGGSQSN